MTMKDNYQKNVWPWNTARVVDHLNEIIYDTARENIDVVIRANPITGKYGSIENLEDAAQFCQDLVDATDSPIVFRKTFFNTVCIYIKCNYKCNLQYNRNKIYKRCSGSRNSNGVYS